MRIVQSPASVERWCVYEVTLHGAYDGNPFIEHALTARLTSNSESKTVPGFYDGNGLYRVRFMPAFAEEYRYSIGGNFFSETIEGTFMVTPAAEGNHGQVRVADTYHFAYEDGTPHYSVGTTCYVWTHQSEEMQRRTLETLAEGYFNKIRFCVLPKHYDYNLDDPSTFPFEGSPCGIEGITRENFANWKPDNPDNHWDFTRLNPLHFQNIERRIEDLMLLGIEADIIVMHPYDRWGFSCMDRQTDDLYWKYILARFSAYRNVWWSLANEYDIMSAKTLEDWEHYADLIREYDPYSHLRSIHNCRTMYDYSRPWITHCSLQRIDATKTTEYTGALRERYGKPIVWDEICYEGNIQYGWGNISGQELTRRFWEAVLRGGYAGHGGTYVHQSNRLWWSHGGTLHGESQSRIGFLKRILEETPGIGLLPVQANLDGRNAVACGDSGYMLFYYSFNRPTSRVFRQLDADAEYHVEILDTWDMTIRDMGVMQGQFTLPLPGKEYIAVRVRRL